MDDLLIIAPTTTILGTLKKKLANEFDMKDLGPISFYLGIRVVRDRKARKVSLVQDAYINKILRDHGFEDCRPRRIPMDPNITL